MFARLRTSQSKDLRLPLPVFSFRAAFANLPPLPTRRKPFTPLCKLFPFSREKPRRRVPRCPKKLQIIAASPNRNWPHTCTKARYSSINRLASPIGELMRLSKLSLLGAVATLALSGLSSHADSLSLGSSGPSLHFTFDGDNLHSSGGNFTPSSAVIGGKTVDFSAVYCVDL